jgi:hypothetical protein
VVSALAEGADRLVAKKVLTNKDARLEVALPLPEEEYLEDFKDEASKEEFLCLLGQASETPWQALDGLDREVAYERAGRYVVDRCDALIALWDGKKSRGRGGTAENRRQCPGARRPDSVGTHRGRAGGRLRSRE